MTKARGNKEYAAKLRDPRWQRKRLEILERDQFCCRWCDSSEKELHVHHNFYISGLEPWDYEQEALTTVCKDCHKMLTGQLARLRTALAKLCITRLSQVIGYVEALAPSGAVDPLDHEWLAGALDGTAPWGGDPHWLLQYEEDDGIDLGKVADERRQEWFDRKKAVRP